MKRTMIMVFGFLGLVSGAMAAAGSGGAKINKPFKEQIDGAECFTSKLPKYAGLVAFGFPDRTTRNLAFTIGPLTDGMSPTQEKNMPYHGPGKYTHVGISGKSKDGKKTFVGYGTITVNADGRTGTFKLEGGKAGGSWDCGLKIPL
jgi:hypothetical protein